MHISDSGISLARMDSETPALQSEPGVSHTSTTPFLASLLRPWFILLKLTGFYPLLTPQKPGLDGANRFRCFLHMAVKTFSIIWSFVFIIGVLLQFSIAAVPGVVKAHISGTSDIVRQACKVTMQLVNAIGVPYFIWLYRNLDGFFIESNRFTSIYVKPIERVRIKRIAHVLTVVQVVITAHRIYEAISVPAKYVETDFVNNLLSICGDTHYRGLRILARIIYDIEQVNGFSMSLSQLTFIVIWLVVGMCYSHLNDRLAEAASEDVDKLLEEHAALTNLILSLERKITYLTLALYTNDFVCMLYMIGCSHENSLDTYVPSEAMSTEIFAYMALRTFAFIYTSEQANSASNILHCMTRREITEPRRIDLFMRLYQMDSIPITFSLGGVMVINRTFILSIFGMIITYTIVILQMDQKDVPELNAAEWKNLFNDALKASKGNITEMIIQQNNTLFYNRSFPLQRD